jgi:hypothetical protein
MPPTGDAYQVASACLPAAGTLTQTSAAVKVKGKGMERGRRRRRRRHCLPDLPAAAAGCLKLLVRPQASLTT